MARLNESLASIRIPVGLSIVGVDGVSEMVEARLHDKEVKEIKQAFLDAGWTPPEKMNDDVKKIVEAFKQANNVPSVRPTDRTSARVLAKAYGADNIIQIIQVMAAHKGEQYVPSINHIKDIETKWVMLERWFKKYERKDVGF